MAKKTIITGLLALIFFFSGHLFITAYTQYHINQKKLGVLRGQERAIKNQQKEFVQKKLALDKVKAFMDLTSELGLEQDQWDRFYVDLKEEGVSFSKLETILAQTASSSQYYFKPVSLEIRTGSKKTISQTDSQKLNSHDMESFDAVISMEGHFLVNRRGLHE